MLLELGEEQDLCQEMAASGSSSLMVVSAILSFRSVGSYAMEAKSRHVKAGYGWTAELQSAYLDVKRAAIRALGADEVLFVVGTCRLLREVELASIWLNDRTIV